MSQFKEPPRQQHLQVLTYRRDDGRPGGGVYLSPGQWKGQFLYLLLDQMREPVRVVIEGEGLFLMELQSPEKTSEEIIRRLNLLCNRLSQNEPGLEDIKQDNEVPI